MKITVIGTGYVGLVTAACLAEVGNRVIGLDQDRLKIAKLRRGEVPIFEPGLSDLVTRNLERGHLSFTHDYGEAFSDVEAVFIAVGTPSDEDGSADLSHVLSAAREAARHVQSDCLFVLKSTVPVGTHRRVEEALAEVLATRQNPPQIRVVNNPEFLREGQAVEDFLRPARIIVGVDHPEEAEVLRHLYAPFTRQRERFLVMDRASAEMTKYASNAMLATRISFMNELARLCEHLGADIEQVRKGMGMDPRIGSQFLYAGLGYGGSCFPKDIRALLALGKEVGEPLSLLEAVHKINREQRRRFAQKIVRALAEVEKPVVALWGLAFKPGTDDMREAPSLVVIEELLRAGVQIRAFDPAALERARVLLRGKEGITFVATAEECLDGADALVLVTEWLCFRTPDWQEVRRRMRGRWVFDGRNIYDPHELAYLGFCYQGIGRGRGGRVQSAESRSLSCHVWFSLLWNLVLVIMESIAPIVWNLLPQL